jgi:hypothetical protein
MYFFNQARYVWAGHGDAGAVFPGRNRNLRLEEVEREDIIRLLVAEEIAVTPDFARLLRDRRRELRESWRRVMQLRVESWEAAGWYADASDTGTLPCT